MSAEVHVPPDPDWTREVVAPSVRTRRPVREPGWYVEVQSPQAKLWLVRLEASQIGVRPGPNRLTLRDEVIAVLPELIAERGEFRLRDLVARLNLDNDLAGVSWLSRGEPASSLVDREVGSVPLYYLTQRFGA